MISARTQRNAQQKNPDLARDLIQDFQDCQWRSTRLKIIRDLSLNPTQRGLEFLFQVARKVDDLPFSEAAIWSLGQSHHVHAARFLACFYRFSPETLKPAVVAALGQIPDRSCLSEFMAELPHAVEKEDFLLVRNLLLTLGEIKAREASPWFIKTMETAESSDLKLSALISLGKVERDPALLDRFEEVFRENLLEYQLFSSVKQQIQFRSQWKLEDYLQRVFESVFFHRTLPYELNHFDPRDVKEGLKLFEGPQYFQRLCLALSKLSFPGLSDWYQEFFKFDQLTSEQMGWVLESVSSHTTDEMKPLLEKIRDFTFRSSDESLFKKWTQALALSLPSADQIFAEMVSQNFFKQMTSSQKIIFLNSIADFGLSVQVDSERIKKLDRVLSEVLQTETDASVLGRALRVAGDLGIQSKKIFEFAKSKILENPLSASCVRYFELIGNEPALVSLDKLLEDPELSAAHAPGLLKAFTAQRSLPQSAPLLDSFLEKSLTNLNCLSALQLLSKHPRKGFLPAVLKVLGTDKLLTLHAIVALRGYSDESVADHLAPFLLDENSIVQGRTLDTLLGLPGIRAKRLVIDFLSAHAENEEICEKIIRCLIPPETTSDYFTDVIDSVLQCFKTHPMRDGLLSLKEKIGEGSAGQGGDLFKKGSLKGPVKGKDTAALDHELMKNLKAYSSYDEGIQAALRSAEMPIQHPNIYDEYVDKSASVLGYCKATDMVLDREFGKKRLLPKLENDLHTFQNILYLVGLNDPSPNAERVLSQLGIGREHFSGASFPLHKTLLISQGILSGRILNEHFKILDGLRAWAIFILLFCRPFKPEGGVREIKPPFALQQISGGEIVVLAKRLLALQDIRNPAAHRQTLLKFVALDEVRKEVFQLLNRFSEMF